MRAVMCEPRGGRSVVADALLLSVAALFGGCTMDVYEGDFTVPLRDRPVHKAPGTSGGSPAELPGGDAVIGGGQGGDDPGTGGGGGAAGENAGAGGMQGASAGAGAGGMEAGGEGGSAGAEEPPPISEWRRMGYDLASTFYNSAERRITKDSARQLEVAWTANMGGPVYGAPLQVGDVIYASSVARVTAFEAETGRVLWSVPVGSYGSLSYEGGALYLVTSSADLIALDAVTGAQLWTRPVDPEQPDDGYSSVVIADDVLLAGGSGLGVELQRLPFRGFLGGFQRATGGGLWRTYTVPETARGAGIWSTPSVDLEAVRVFVTTGNNYGLPATDTSNAFIALDLHGNILWKNQRLADDSGLLFENEDPNAPGLVSDLDFGANPVLYEAMVDGVMTGLVSAGAKSGTAHALRRSDGTVIWSRSLGTGDGRGERGIFSNSTWTGQCMLFAMNEGESATLHALDGATGNLVWSSALPGKVWGRIAVVKGVGFVGAGEQLLVFDTDTGAFIKDFPTTGTVASTITVANGRVAFGQGLAWSDGRHGDTLTVLAVP